MEKKDKDGIKHQTLKQDMYKGIIDFDDLYTVVDAGAFRGAWSIALTERCTVNPPLIYAVEPVSFQLLSRCVGPYKNIIPIERGFSDRCETVEFVKGSSGAIRAWDEKSRPKLAKWGSIMVRCMSWDMFCDRYDITDVDLLKCDIEGSEELLFKAMTRMFPTYVEVEFHPVAIKRARQAFSMKGSKVESFMDKHYDFIKRLNPRSHGSSASLYRLKG